MTRIKKDLQKYLQDNLQDLADEHLDMWADRYAKMGIKAVAYDLSVNYDFSADFESVEQEIGRPLTSDEQQIFIKKFIAMIKKIRG